MPRFEAGDLIDGDLKHTDLQVIPNGPAVMIMLTVDRRVADKTKLSGEVMQIAGGDVNGFLSFANKPEDAPIVYFNGPLQMVLQPGNKLTKGDPPSTLRVGVGTPGIGKGSCVYSMCQFMIPEDTCPLAEIEFPPAKPGQAPIKSKVALVQGRYLSGPVRVPAEAGVGVAKIRLSFDDWKEVDVAPTTVEVQVGDK